MNVYRISEVGVNGDKKVVMGVYYNHDVALDNLLKFEDGNDVDSGEYYIMETIKMN